MNILQISDGYVKIPPNRTGPIETVIFNISRQLVRMGHNVTILERRHLDSDSEIEYIDGIKIIRLDTTRLKAESGLISIVFSAIDFALSANNYIQSINDSLDIIHLHLPLSGIVLLNLNKKIKNKSIYTYHGDGYRLSLNKSIDSPHFLKIFSPDKYLMKKTKITIVLNESIRQEIIKQGIKNRYDIVAIGHGVELENFTPAYQRDIDGKKKFSILFVGGITERKGIIYLLKAIDIIVNKYEIRNLSVLLVGPIRAYGFFQRRSSADYFMKLNEFIERKKLNEFIIFTDYVNNEILKEFYQTSDLFVLPSIEEGFGLVLTEAMSSGLPLIGSNVGGIPTQIRDGWNGFLVKPRDYEELAEKIKYLIINRDVRYQMAKNSRTLAEKAFSWERKASEYINIYEAIRNGNNYNRRV